MDLPEILPFRKKVLSPHCHGSAAPSSTMAPPPPHCDDVLSGVPPATSDLLPTESFPHEAPPTLPDVPPAKLGLVQLENLPDVHQQIQETMEHEPAPFVPSMGAWSKPLVLNFPPPSTPPEPSTPHSYDFQLVHSQIENFWPSLEDSTNLKQKKSLLKGAPPSLPNLPVSKLPPPELKDDGSLRFPWAARMNPTSRNLFRASRPTFRLDGTPEIIIPAKVLELGPENVGEYVIGQFHRCSIPSGGLMHAVVNRLWGRSCKIVSRKLGESSYLFHVPHKETRNWIIQRSVWHVDDCLMFVAPWNPVGSLKIPEISTVPAWVTLKNIPTSCYSRLGISHIASGLGEPMLMHKPRLDPFNIGEAKILVEIELDKNFPKKIALDDKLGNIFLVDVVYSWIPSTCERCGSLGHKAKRCLLKEDKIVLPNESRQDQEKVDIPVVDINSLLVNTESSKETLESNMPKVIEDILPIQTVAKSSTVLQSHHTPSQFGGSEAFSEKTGSSFQGATSSKDSFNIAFEHLSPNVKLTSASTLAGSPSAHTTPAQIMDNAPSAIISKESVTPSGTDPINTTPPSTKFIQEHVNMESDFHINEQMDEYGSVSRGGRLLKPAQRYQEMEWHTVRGRGNRGRKGRGS